MKIKPTLWILSVLLFWIVGPVGTPRGLANGPVGSSGCVDDTWRATSVGASDGRVSHTAVWTGTEMIGLGRRRGGCV